MSEIIVMIVVIIFLLLSFYFSFIPHNTQCNMIRWLMPKCFPHWFHIGAGLIFFGIAVVVYHNDYLLKLKIQD
jgi:hypothetical protein